MGIGRILASRKIYKILRMSFLIGFVILPGLILSVVKFSALPYLYPSSTELAANVFLYDHQPKNMSVVYLENNRPWMYPYILERTTNYYMPVIMLNSVGGTVIAVLGSKTLLVTDRLITRDAFNLYDPTMYQLIRNVSEFTKTTHNKVYDAGGFNWVLQPVKSLGEH